MDRYLKIKKKGSFIKEGLGKAKGKYQAEADMYKGNMEVFKRLIPVEPDQEYSSYEKGCDAKVKRYGYSYEYPNDNHELTEEQCKVVEKYNNSAYKYMNALENAQLTQALHSLLNDKDEYEFTVGQLIEMGLGTDEMD